MRDLTGRRVLITGGARGIGLEMGIRFAEQGATVLLADLDAEELPEAVAAVAVLGGVADGFVVDVTDAESVARLRHDVLERHGPPDVLINNAGIVHGGGFTEVPLRRHLQTYRVNVEGVVTMTHAFLDDLTGRPEASLVNIASASGFIGLPLAATYASSKWAVIGLSESLRAEMKHTGNHHVHVCAVCPSYIGTGMFQGVRPPSSTRMLEPEFIARRVLDAVRHERPWVIEPWLAKLTPALKGMLPTPVFDRISSILGADRGMSTWTGRGSAEQGRQRQSGQGRH